MICIYMYKNVYDFIQDYKILPNRRFSSATSYSSGEQHVVPPYCSTKEFQVEHTPRLTELPRSQIEGCGLPPSEQREGSRARQYKQQEMMSPQMEMVGVVEKCSKKLLESSVERRCTEQYREVEHHHTEVSQKYHQHNVHYHNTEIPASNHLVDDCYNADTREGARFAGVCYEQQYGRHVNNVADYCKPYDRLDNYMQSSEHFQKSSLFSDHHKRGLSKKHVMWKDVDLEDEDEEMFNQRTTVTYHGEEYYEEEVIEACEIRVTTKEVLIKEEMYHEAFTVKHRPEDLNFHNIIGGKLPSCDVECSPVRRQTFVKGEVEFSEPLSEESIDGASLTLRDLVHEPSDDALEISAQMRTQTVSSARLPTPSISHPSKTSSNGSYAVAQSKFQSEAEFRSMKGEHLHHIVSDSPARRETYIAEAFRSVDVGKNLPLCDAVDCSPLRRQTFDKSDPDCVRRTTLTLGSGSSSNVSFSHTNAPKRHPFSDMSNISETSTPSASENTPLLRSAHPGNPMLAMTPITPVTIKVGVKSGLNTITASCMDLLNQLDLGMADSPNSTLLTNASPRTERRFNLEKRFQECERIETDPFELKKARQIEAKETVHALLSDDSLDSSLNISKLDNLRNPFVGRKSLLLNDGSEARPSLNMSPLATPSLRRISEVSLVSSGSSKQDGYHQTVSPSPGRVEKELRVSAAITGDEDTGDACNHSDYDSAKSHSSDSSSSESEVFKDSLENCLDALTDDEAENICAPLQNTKLLERNESPAVHTEEQNKLADSSVPALEDVEAMEEYFRRLSTGTVTKETSILLPEDIVNIDDIPPHKAATDDIPPETWAVEADNVIEVPYDCNPSPWSDENNRPISMLKSLIDDPVLTTTVIIEQQTVNPQLLCRQNELQSNIVKTSKVNVYNHRTGMSEKSFMCASLSEFSFHPSDDPRRCSTGVKAAPPSEVLNARNLEGGRMLFNTAAAGIHGTAALAGEESGHLVSAPDGDVSAVRCGDDSRNAGQSPLTTIVESEERNNATSVHTAPTKNSTFDTTSPSVMPGKPVHQFYHAVESNVPSTNSEGMADLVRDPAGTRPQAPPTTEKKHGLHFIEISPPNKRRAQSPAAKQPGWNKTKKTRSVEYVFV